MQDNENMSVISRAVFICTHLALKLKEREDELQALDSRKKIKRFYPTSLEDEPSLVTCLSHAQKTVAAIRDTDARLYDAKERRAMSILEEFAEEFDLPSDEEEEEESD
jgi:hypothetical protein